jgi:hypothetical protein
MRRIAIVAILICLAILFSGCAWSGKTVKDLIRDPNFKKENLPIRTLSLAIATDKSYDDKQILKCVEETSDLIEIQVGINLEVAAIMPISWKGKKNIEDMLIFLKTTAKIWEVPFDFDVVIGFAAFREEEKDNPYPDKGITDTSDASRFIIIRTLAANALAHEIFHAVTKSPRHSRGGIMKSWFLETKAGEPIRDEDYYLLPEDRERILENKWRKF